METGDWILDTRYWSKIPSSAGILDAPLLFHSKRDLRSASTGQGLRDFSDDWRFEWDCLTIASGISLRERTLSWGNITYWFDRCGPPISDFAFRIADFMFARPLYQMDLTYTVTIQEFFKNFAFFFIASRLIAFLWLWWAVGRVAIRTTKNRHYHLDISNIQYHRKIDISAMLVNRGKTCDIIIQRANRGMRYVMALTAFWMGWKPLACPTYL